MSKRGVGSSQPHGKGAGSNHPIKPVKGGANKATPVVKSTKGAGEPPVHPHQMKHNTGSASPTPKHSPASQSGAYGLYKKYSY
jgi:hypothetical protein